MKELLQREEYEWMVKVTPQREWIASQGVFLWLAFFFSEIGAGIYFVSLFSEYHMGLIVGWLITMVLGGVIHMLYLGNPFRAWRIFLKPQNSELSRGVWGIFIFGGLGFVQIALFYTPYQSLVFGIPLKIVAGILCLIIIMHGFMTMNVMKALPSWNSSMLLPLSLVSGIWVGSQVVQYMLLLGQDTSVNMAVFERWSLLLLLVYIAFILFYIMGTLHSSETAKLSVRDWIRGTGAKVFYITVLCGMIIPLLVTFYNMGVDVQLPLVLVRLISVAIGDMMLRYGLMKNAYYTPLI
jgi:DMSO reductase anchor subunit